MGYKQGFVVKTFFNSYTVHLRVGGGGAGEVYKVHDSDGASLAIKVIDSAKANTTKLKRFRNEANFCAKDVHPNVIKISEYGVTDKGDSFYVMPLYPKTLRDLMSRACSHYCKVLLLISRQDGDHRRAV